MATPTIVRDIPPPINTRNEDVMYRPTSTANADAEPAVTSPFHQPALGLNNNNNNPHHHQQQRPTPSSAALPAMMEPTDEGGDATTDAASSDDPQTFQAPTIKGVATLSNPWEYDIHQHVCTSCGSEFNLFNRKHHCRLCGKIFCNDCTKHRALIPPSSIVLSPQGGKKANPTKDPQRFSFSPDPDPDRMLTYIDDSNDQQMLLHGKGLEERFLLAREPLRVCAPCHQQLEPQQSELRIVNANCMRFNPIDPSDPKRFFNSPIANTLGHEVRKAAYTLNNLLPTAKKMGRLLNNNTNFTSREARELQQCQDECATIGPNLSGLDGVKIPARLLEHAKGIAVVTVLKGGFGLAGMEVGTGLVVARLGQDQWSAPCAIGMAGVSWGALVGAQVCDHVFLLMTDAAVELMFSNKENVQLGVDVGVAIGPLGRALEADVGAAPGTIAPIYTYSLSKGLYAGISVDGKIIKVRDKVNAKFYGKSVTGEELLSGEIPTPPAARILYEALQRCHVYAGGNGGFMRKGNSHNNGRTSQSQTQAQQQFSTSKPSSSGEFSGFVNDGVPLTISQQQQQHQQQHMPADAYSTSGVSDITYSI